MTQTEDLKIYNFIKEESGRWYIILPDYPGKKADLEMVAGADDMLNVISNGGNECNLAISEQPFEDSNVLDLIKEKPPEIGGGDYILQYYEGLEINHKVWLCDVVKFIFGRMPKTLYFK